MSKRSTVPMAGGSRRGVCLRVLGLVLAGSVALAAAGDAHAGSRAKGLFNSTEKRTENLKAFPKWTKVLDRYIAERKKQEGSCQETTFNKCHYQKWQQLIASLEGKSKKAQLRAVNKYANSVRYVLDPKNWGKKDYWASPGQFFVKNGDCEDYAITKFLTLRALGFDTAKLRIVVVQDLSLRIAHGILAVYHKGKIYILDNQMTMVTEDRRIRHYKPIFSLNEEAWWRHRPIKKKKRG